MAASAIRPHRRLVALAIAAGLGLVAFQGTAMAAMTIFSAVRGKVVDHGVPVAGAVIEREYRWGWKDETETDRATTDAAGRFALPAVERRSLLGSILPHEPLVRQTILIHHAGKTYRAWGLIKHNYDENGELDGRPIVITCRLEAEARRHDGIFGMCDID